MWSLCEIPVSHLPDDNGTDIDVDDVGVADIIHVLAELGVSTAHHEDLVWWFHTLVDHITQLGVLAIPRQRNAWLLVHTDQILYLSYLHGTKVH